MDEQYFILLRSSDMQKIVCERFHLLNCFHEQVLQYTNPQINDSSTDEY